jgi:hypothetical protein
MKARPETDLKQFAFHKLKSAGNSLSASNAPFIETIIHVAMNNLLAKGHPST